MGIYRFVTPLWAGLFAALLAGGIALNLTPTVALVLSALLFAVARVNRPLPVYCVDHSEFTAPESWSVSRADVARILATNPELTQESVAFAERIMVNSGIGEETAWPPNLVASLASGKKWSASFHDARSEMEVVMGEALQDLLMKTGVRAKEIDFLVLNCSFFNPTPSLCSLISNKFGLRSDCQTYNLSGMGCSANGISVDLARRVLQGSAKRGALCVIISAESMAQQLYEGNDRGRLLSNTLFRSAGAAVLLTNDATRACKYELLQNIRAQVVTPEGFSCVWQGLDQDGRKGLLLGKNLVDVAGQALELNLARLSPLVAPFFDSLLGRQVDLRRSVDHWCIHAGGRAVIDGMRVTLGLTEQDVLPSRAVLHRYGNTLSTSVWYEMAFLEKRGVIKAGHQVLQIALGSGFKCNSAMWLCL